MRLLTRVVTQWKRGERGQVTAWVVCISIVLFGLMAFTTDVGFWLVDRRYAQNQADAAALAAVQELPASDTTEASDMALEYLRRNGTAAVSVCVEDPDEDYTWIDQGVAFGDQDSDGNYRKVRVCISRGSKIFFSALLDLTGVEIRSVAAARIRVTPKPYALMAMNPTACSSMLFTGNNVVILDNAGSSYTKSSCSSNAFQVNGNHVELTAGDGATHDVVGGAGGCASGPLTNCVTPDPADGQSSFILDDPFGCVGAGSCVPVPTVNNSVNCSNPANNRSFTSGMNSLPPGTYCALSVTSSAVVTLTGGVYVFKEGVTVAGNGRLTSGSAEVLIYITCPSHPCNGASPAPFATSGNSASSLPRIDIKGHSSYESIAIWVDRTAGGATVCESGTTAKVSITGQADVVVNGNIYAISTTVDMGGNGEADFDINGSIVADRICFRGNATYHVDWDVTVDTNFELDLVE